MTGKKSATSKAALRNPLYVKIGKRIRQARLMARESNSRDLSLRLGWSGGRLHNYETGLSTPGVDETLQFCEAVRVDPICTAPSSALKATKWLPSRVLSTPKCPSRMSGSILTCST